MGLKSASLSSNLCLVLKLPEHEIITDLHHSNFSASAVRRDTILSSSSLSQSSRLVLDQLTSLAQEKSSEKRRELLSSLADLFYSEPAAEPRAPGDIRLFADVVSRVLKDVNIDGRANFADRIALDPRMPREMIMTLASDEISVARPILTHSPILTDGDLISLASGGDTARRLAISKRETIAESVTDVLIDFGEMEVAQSLAGNVGAEVSNRGFEKMSTMAEENQSLGRKLSVRRDLPRNIAEKILPHLKPTDAAKLQRLIAAEDSTELEAVVDNAEKALIAERAGEAKQRINIRHWMDEVAHGRKTLDAAVDAIVATGKPTDVALALSLVSGLPERQVTNAVISVKAEPLALICRAIGIGTATYLAIDRLRAASVNLSASTPAVMQQLYDVLDMEGARRTLRFVQVRNTVSPG